MGSHCLAPLPCIICVEHHLQLEQQQRQQQKSRPTEKIGCKSTVLRSFPQKNHNHRAKIARASARIGSLEGAVADAQKAVDNAVSTLSLHLAKAINDKGDGDIFATAVARRTWWAEARKNLVDLLLLAHGINGRTVEGGNTSIRVAGPGASAIETPLASVPGLVPLVQARLNDVLDKDKVQHDKT